MTETDQVELLPCPFCGHEARADAQFVYCGGCLAQMPEHDEDCGSTLDRWNTRHTAEARLSVDREAIARTLHRASHPFANWDDTRPECKQRLSEADAIISALGLSVDGWQPIETAPRDGTIVLGYRAGWSEADTIRQARWEIDIEGDALSFAGWIDPNADDEWTPTHWLPLPAPPVISAGKGVEG